MMVRAGYVETNGWLPSADAPCPQVTWIDGRDQAPIHLPDGGTHWVDVDPRPRVGYVR